MKVVEASILSVRGIVETLSFVENSEESLFEYSQIQSVK